MCFVAVLALIPCSAVSQEALRSAVTEDKAASVRQSGLAVQPHQLRIGPVNFALGTALGVELNDNINISDVNRQSDIILRPEVSIDGQWPISKTSQLTLGAGVGYAKYLRFPEHDRLSLNPNSALGLDIPARDFVFTFYDRFQYSQDVVSEPALSGVTEFPRFNNTVGTRVTWLPDTWLFQVGYAHFNFLSAGGNFDYLDRSSEQFLGRAGYRFRPETHAGVEVTGSLTDYYRDIQRDNSSFSFGPFLEWKVMEMLQVTLRGGYVNNTFDPTNAFGRQPIPPPSNPSLFRSKGQSLNSYYVNFEIGHRLTDFISHSLSGEHEIRAGVNQGSDYIESSTARYQVSWALLRHTSLSANASYEMGRQPSIGTASQTEDYEQFGFGISLLHNITERSALGLGYNFFLKESNLADRGYKQNSVLLTVRYRF